MCCTSEVMNCEWKAELNDINDLLGNSSGCLFGEIKSSNEYGKMIERYYLIFHVETVCPCDHVIRYNINFSVIP